jgi:hypothetical protein
MFQDANNQFDTFGLYSTNELSVEEMLDSSYVGDPAEDIAEAYGADISPMRIMPRVENYRFDAAIGDAYLEGDTQVAPAWKIVALNGTISSSAQKDTKNDVNIPQINIDLNYVREIQEYDPNILLTEENYREVVTTTEPFADNRVIKLVQQDLLVYGDEVNTALLSENFDIEVFEIVENAYTASCSTCSDRDVLKRKYFPNNNTSIKGGLMTIEEASDGTLMAINNDGRPSTSIVEETTTNSVAYYFDILKDTEISPSKACKAAVEFNRDSYYVDLDFDCDKLSSDEIVEIDIYGKVTEPEICL